jgi:RNA polymerase sigma-70 factor (ECF subfamily)
MTDSTSDDPDLLEACSNGDEHALGSLYDRYGKVAYGLALRILHDPALAEDAVQDAFLTVWRQAATYDRARGHASAWILMLVHRRAVDLVRRQHRRYALPVGLERAAPVASAESVDEDVAVRGDVQAALCTLSSLEREVLALAYWGGLTQSQIGTALGIPLGTVKSRTVSALAKLREALCQATYLIAV